MPLHFPPRRVIGAATLVAALASIAALWAAVQTPSLGLRWQAEGANVRVFPLKGAQLAPGLRPGTEVVALSGAGASVPLRADDLTPEPDVTFPQVSGYRAFQQRQDRLAQVMAATDLRLVTADGREWAAAPRAARPLSELPWSFWLQVLCGALGLVSGAAVWAYRQRDPAAAYYALTGLGLAAAALSAAVYSSRELAMSFAMLEPLRMVNQAGTLGYTAAFVAVLWHYPQRLGSFAMGPLLLGVYALAILAIWFYWLPSLDLLMRAPALAGFALAILLGIWQWRRSRGEPLARAGLRWFLISWFFGSGLFLALVFVPPLFGADAAAAQGPAFALLLVIHLALAVGILRYRLFALDRWWSRAWLLGLSGLAIFSLDLLLIHVIGFAESIALGLSLALVGWLYFPLRQWLWDRFLRGNRAQPAELMRRVTDVLAHPEQDPDQAWQALLSQVYGAGVVESIAPVATDAICEGGLTLEVGGIGVSHGWRLRYCDDGARLFRREDLSLLADLRLLFAEVLRYRNRLHDAVAAERDRVARDLHDDVGARLLTLAQRVDPSHAEQVREAIGELRSVIYSMHNAHTPLAHALGDWRAEVSERCEVAGFDLTWQLDGEPPPLNLSGASSLALTRVLRESVSNALRHNAAATLSVRLQFEGTKLAAFVHHPYAGPPPAQWRESLGLHNLRERMTRLGGTIEWQLGGGRLETRWAVNLTGAGLVDAGIGGG